jgi:hypothetical protein
MMYLGDYVEDGTLAFLWGTNDGDGASITRATDGTVQVYKDDGDTESVAGITDTEDFDGLTGLHLCKIDLSADAFYAVGSDYTVVVKGAVIDGNTVNAPLATFSIENRAAKAAIGAPVALDGGAETLASMLQKLADDNDGGDFDAESDSQKAIRNAIAAAAPELFAPDGSSAIVTGNQDAGTYASCAADDGNRWTIGDENGANTIDVICEFNMGANRNAVELDVNGYFNRSGGGGYIVEMYAWNYTTASWEKLSAGTASTEMRDRSSDADYLLPLHSGNTDRVTTPGEVKINFRSTRGTTASGDVLYLDYVSITGSAAGASPDVIAAAVHEELDVHLSHIKNFTGDIRYVDAGGGNDANAGEYPNDAFATISAAVTASSAGDMIVVKAGSYAEAVTLAAAGLELHCEIGTVITGAGGTPLTVSADDCKVIEAYLTPAGGQTGFSVSGDNGYFERLQCHVSGATGFAVTATGQRNQFFNCIASEFTVAGFDIKGFTNVFDQCHAVGNGGTETGFHLSDTAAHRNVFDNCSSVDCATAGWDIDAGADDNLFVMCSNSVGCGATVNAGANNAFRGFLDSDIESVNLNANAITATVFDQTTAWAANEAIVTYKLDHLVYVADGDDPADNSIMAKLAAGDGDWSTYVASTDALQALRDRGDAAWITGAGGDATEAKQDIIIAYIDTEIAAIKAKTDTLPALPAATGADGDTLKTLSDQIDTLVPGSATNLSIENTDLVIED